MTKNLKISLALLLILQITIAANFGLAHDEAYYWVFSRNLDWGFFDHPPMVALIIRLFSFLPHSEWAVRIGFIFMQFGALLLTYKMIPSRHWVLATLLYFSFPLASLGGMFALPDMPLLFFTAVYCYFLSNFLKKTDVSNSMALGFAIAFLLYSKYHGILLIFFTIIALPKLFKNKFFYLVALVALLLFLPHIWWQHIHGYSTLKYHFLERPKSDFSFGRSLEYLVLQIGLAGVFVGPLLWFGVLKEKTENEFSRAMKFISIGTVIFFFVSTFSKKFEANWTIFLTIPLIVLITHSDWFERGWFRKLTYASFALVFIARFLLVAPPEMFHIKRLKEFHGWRAFSAKVSADCQGPILANTYQLAGKLSFYLQEPIHALNYHSRKNQFDYWMPDETYYLSPFLCYVTDKKEFGGTIILTPEEKKLRLVKNFSPSGLGQR